MKKLLIFLRNFLQRKTNKIILFDFYCASFSKKMLHFKRQPQADTFAFVMGSNGNGPNTVETISRTLFLNERETLILI